MDVVVLWLCFLAVLGGIALAVSVILRDGRHYVSARRAGATRLQAVAQVPAARKLERPAAAAPRASGRRLGQLMPAPASIPAARPRPVENRPRGRVLGQLIPDVQTTEAVTGRGLGRLVSDRSG